VAAPTGNAAGDREGGPADALDPDRPLAGTLHVFVAFDWGEDVHLEHARRLVPAEVQALPRRRRTPTSFAYRPPPLRFLLPPMTLELPEVGSVQPQPEATLFDFAAVSLGLHVPFRLPPAGLTCLAGWLAEPSSLVQAAQAALAPLFQSLRPALQGPKWRDDFSEDYFVFQLSPDDVPAPDRLLAGQAATWLAGLLRLDANPLSTEEAAEALRLHLSYSPQDLFVPDWGAAVLIDHDCDETLQTVEFTNLQLLEYRFIDDRLDGDVASAYRVIHRLTQSRLPVWRTHGRRVRLVGELKVEANELFERTGNVLKLVGDQYLARIYRQLAGRFHLPEWEQSIERKLDVLEGVYRVLADQSATYRAELLEVIVVGLILFEIAIAFWRPG
jgi:hypothetical protein